MGFIFFSNRDDVLAVTVHGFNPRSEEDLSKFHDDKLFQGNDAQITARRMYNEIFTCEFHLKMYPFDSQICSMNFRLVQHQITSVRLATACPWEIPLEREITVGEFRVTRIEGKKTKNVRIFILINFLDKFSLFLVYNSRQKDPDFVSNFFVWKKYLDILWGIIF